MLDKRTTIFLNYIVSQSGQGAYQVFNTEDMLSAMPKKFKMNADNISQMISYLAERGFISVKHRDEQLYCLAPLPKARLNAEQNETFKRDTSKNRKLIVFVLFLVFILSFLGAFLGAYLAITF